MARASLLIPTDGALAARLAPRHSRPHAVDLAAVAQVKLMLQFLGGAHALHAPAIHLRVAGVPVRKRLLCGPLLTSAGHRRAKGSTGGHLGRRATFGGWPVSTGREKNPLQVVMGATHRLEAPTQPISRTIDSLWANF